MVKLLGLTLPGTDSSTPREIAGGGATATASNGWLIRFFDSSFFSPWIAVSYLYKHDHAGVRDYLCNRMYALPLPALEPYLFQLCYMLVHKPSPSLDKFLVDTCGKSLRIALKVHWFLLAEVESSEDEGIVHVQEECQIAATVTADWPLLIRTAPVPASPRMLNRIFSRKDAGTGGNDSEERTLFKKLMPGAKVRDALSFRKSVEKEEEDRDGFFRRLLSASKEEDAEKDGVLRRMIRDGDEGLASSSDGMFKRLFRDKEGKLGEEKKDEEMASSSHGVIKRLFRDKEERLGEEEKKDEEVVSSSNEVIKRSFRDKEGNLGEEVNKEEEVASSKRIFHDKEEKLGDEDNKDEEAALSSGGVIKRWFRDEEDKLGEEDKKDEEDGLIKRLFGDKEEKLGGEDKREGFFHKMFKEKKDGAHADSYKGRGSVEDDDRESFFKKLFKDKHEEKKFDGLDRVGEEDKSDESTTEEKEGFFRKIFKEKGGEKKDAGDGENEGEDKGRGSVEDKGDESMTEEKEGFFRKIFKEKGGEKKDAGDGENEGEDKGRGSVEDDDKRGLFKRIFKDRHDEKKVARHDRCEEEDRCIGSVEDGEKEGFFKTLFKVRNDDRKDQGHHRNEVYNKANAKVEEETSDFLSFRRLFRVHSEVVEHTSTSGNGNPGAPFESSPGTENLFRRLFSDRSDRSVEDSELLGSKKLKEKRPGSPRQQDDKSYTKPPLPNNVTSQIRKGTYHGSLEFVQSLCDTSYGLVDIFPIEDRKIALQESLQDINSHLDAAKKNGGVCFPMGKGMYRVVHIPEDEAVLLNSREKAPYLICVEVLKGEVLSHAKAVSDSQKLSRGGIPLANGDAQLPKPPPWAYPLWNQHDMHNNGMLKSTSQAIDHAMSHSWEAKVKIVHASLFVDKRFGDQSKRNKAPDSGRTSPFSAEDIDFTSAVGQDPNDGLRIKTENDMGWVHVSLSAVPGLNMEDIDYQELPCRKDHHRVPSTIAIEEVKDAAAKGYTPLGLSFKGAGHNSSEVRTEVTNGAPKPGDALSGELWEVKKERIRSLSAYGKAPGWDLRSIIVKSGDDCRQEHLAVQLISHFYDIYQEAGLPLWLRPYEVLVTSSYTALIETIPDTASIHSIKSRYPNLSSLRDYFVAKYEDNSPTFKLAQRNFVESMAGYSILCYLLQLKDRHNGNLLMDEEGHIIHIDFGFLLSNSPGGVNFESAPFKLTRELLEVMDSDAEGNPSDFFDYFKVLCIQGFLICRKHAERIILLVEMLQDSGFPCFKGGPRTIQNLRKRFHLSLTEEQCVSLVLSLISSSLDAWRTRQYDYYQRVLNGIL